MNRRLMMGKTEPEAERRVKIQSGHRSGMGCLVGIFWTIVFLVISFGVAGFFLVDSDGVRQLVRSEVAQSIDVSDESVVFDSLSICFPYNICIEGLDVHLAGDCIMRADRVKLLGVIGFWRGVSIDKGELELSELPDFVELPDVLTGLSVLPEEDIVSFSQYLFKNFRTVNIEVIDSKLAWSQYGVVISGLNLEFEHKVITGDIDANFCSLSFDKYEIDGNQVVDNGRVLWMAYAEDDYIEIMNSALGHSNLSELYFLKERNAKKQDL